MRHQKINEEIYYNRRRVLSVYQNDIDELCDLASKTHRRRTRLCTHLKETDFVHEMLIVHERNIYVPPHKHIKKSESFHIIKGTLEYFGPF